ncbi:variable surface protein [Plasmodium gonderi]|uniref:Variable surface protein n=1 Tax=Plasmodium gonderi TaxID=77519 RepID=A0A1Y1JQ45_PLAGO|nr:variable surface protein [Plasmodium gonderi]GAW84539.1 variable surface protein [Plasmodium gonderi]
MTNEIYKIAKEFLKYENIMNNSDSTGSSLNEDNFIGITNENFPGFSNNVKTICNKFDKYTTTIQTSHYTTMLNNSSCLYLYYWIYYYNNNNQRNIEEVKKLYGELINADSTSHKEICKNYVVTTITEDIMLKLKHLHDMYTKLNSIQNNSSFQCRDKCKCANECAQLYMEYKNPCESNSYSDFCNELINVRETYNTLNKTQCFDQLTYKMLPLFQKSNMAVSIVITIIVIFLITLTLFIMHKFTPYNSCFQGTLRRKRNKWNNIDKDYNIFQSYKNVSSPAMKSRHHILYHKF